jgi:hypothetical protein
MAEVFVFLAQAWLCTHHVNRRAQENKTMYLLSMNLKFVLIYYSNETTFSHRQGRRHLASPAVDGHGRPQLGLGAELPR